MPGTLDIKPEDIKPFDDGPTNLNDFPNDPNFGMPQGNNFPGGPVGNSNMGPMSGPGGAGPGMGPSGPMPGGPQPPMGGPMGPGGPIPPPGGAPPGTAQPLPSNVLGKGSGDRTMDQQYMQTSSQLYVFSTRWANRSAEAVMKDQFQSIIAWHESQPETKQHLEVKFQSLNFFPYMTENKMYLSCK